MSDLGSLLRDHADRTEPPLPPDPAPALSLGRRRLRRRRGIAACVSVAVVGVAGGLAVPLVAGHGDHGGTDHGIDPATARALADYDAGQMPRILEDHVSSVLRRSVDDLPPADFHAGDGQGARLDPEDYDKASGMSVTYEIPGQHRWSVSLSHSRSEAEGDARQTCADDVRAGYYVSCEVSRTTAGDVVITRLGALRLLAPGRAAGWMTVPTGRLDDVDPDTLWFDREVKVVHSETFLTYATEYVKAPDRETAERRLEVPVSDLVEIGTDPELVIPAPPVDDSGCGPWTKDPGISYDC